MTISLGEMKEAALCAAIAHYHLGQIDHIDLTRYIGCLKEATSKDVVATGYLNFIFKKIKRNEKRA